MCQRVYAIFGKCQEKHEQNGEDPLKMKHVARCRERCDPRWNHLSSASMGGRPCPARGRTKRGVPRVERADASTNKHHRQIFQTLESRYQMSIRKVLSSRRSVWSSLENLPHFNYPLLLSPPSPEIHGTILPSRGDRAGPWDEDTTR
jgi:hypothetical protein